MSFEKKFLTRYLDIIIELSNETGISKKEARDMLDIALSNRNLKLVNFYEVKNEINMFITINIFSLLFKL